MVSCFHYFILILPFKFYCKQFLILNILSAICLLIFFVVLSKTYKLKKICQNTIKNRGNCLRVFSNNSRESFPTKGLSLNVTFYVCNCYERRECESKCAFQMSKYARYTSSLYICTPFTQKISLFIAHRLT